MPTPDNARLSVPQCALEDGTRGGGAVGQPGADGLKALVDDLAGLQFELEAINTRRGSGNGGAGGSAHGPGGGGQQGQGQGAPDEVRLAQLRGVAASLQKRVESARAQHAELQVRVAAGRWVLAGYMFAWRAGKRRPIMRGRLGWLTATPTHYRTHLPWRSCEQERTGLAVARRTCHS